MQIRLSLIAAPLLLVFLAACASAPPSRINDACAIFDQRDSFFDNWHSAAKDAEQAHGIPIHVLMATLRKESGFKSHARPPRTKLLGFIPWKRQSSAFGFSQALNGTWAQYQRETGRALARRNRFADAVDFVGWYHAKSASTLGIARSDAGNLYLAYYHGWAGYSRGKHRANASIQRYARETAAMAEKYRAQLARCGRL
ncbi:hypothetical protein [Tianweitania sediminis]|uniref:Transglycosylase SLT domain-containing protein n=1 Tax=Tianweitania sediminis TaxID=1502156 RepID=A0A8J7R1A7_9HYPH|nr:hypothetical protein [Tianweitania sediminis]MBP0440285.1 hypothetical protein [Tianweitania sediminis]